MDTVGSTNVGKRVGFASFPCNDKKLPRFNFCGEQNLTRALHKTTERFGMWRLHSAFFDTALDVSYQTTVDLVWVKLLNEGTHRLSFEYMSWMLQYLSSVQHPSTDDGSWSIRKCIQCLNDVSCFLNVLFLFSIATKISVMYLK